MSPRLIDQLIHRRWSVLVALLATTLFAATFASRVEFDNSIETWFLEDDPSLAVYDRFTDLFRADQLVVVGVFAEDIFADDLLAAIQQISAAAGKLRFVERVHSITDSPIARRLGGIGAPDFRQQILASPLLRGSLLSDDGDAAAIVIYYSRDGHAFRHKKTFVDDLKQLVRAATRGTAASYAITGGPVIGEAAKDRNSGDMTTIVPLMILVIVLIAYGVFRDILLTLLPLAVVTLAVTWAYGVMSLAGWAMSMISAILIPLILAVGVAHTIHIVAAYRLNLHRGQARTEAVRNSVVRLLKPCLFASLTTTAGLLSLLVSSLEPVRQFAVTAATGVVAAFVISITFVPIMLLLIPVAAGSDTAFAGDALSRLLTRIFEFARAQRHGILFTAILVAVAFTWLATRVEAGLDPMLWIPHDDPIRADAMRIDSAFDGGLSLEFLVTSTDGAVTSPAALRHIESFQTWLAANTTVVRATSVVDLVKEAARVAREEGGSGYRLPMTRAVTYVLLDKLSREGQLGPWITADHSTARISARIPLTSAQRIVDEIPAIERRIEDGLQNGRLRVQMTGHAMLAGLMQTNMIDSQLYSFSVALIVVALMMIVLLRSVALGALATIPNLLPIVVGLGAMTLFDIALNPATVMIAAVALGIVVDDTVHVMTAFERDMRATGEIPAAIRSTILEVGRPVVITSVLLAAGFVLLVLGSFLPSRQIGALIALIVSAALVADLIVVPAVLQIVPPSLMRRFLRSACG